MNMTRKTGLEGGMDGWMDADQLFTGENLQQSNKHASIAEVSVEVTDSAGHTAQVRVHPFSESLFLHCLSLIWKREKKKRFGGQTC